MLRGIIENFLGGDFLIKVENLTKEFKIRKKKVDLKEPLNHFLLVILIQKQQYQIFPLKLKSGEIVGYIGSNGLW